MKNQGFRYGEQGGVIVWILVMIALLAALSFAATRGSRTGLSNLDREQSELAANEIIGFAQTVREATRSMKIRGCADTRISFLNTATGLTYNNTTAPNDSSCHVFHGAGAGLTYGRPETSWLDSRGQGRAHYGQWMFTGSSHLLGIGTAGNVGSGCLDGTSGCKELLIGLPYINLNICTAINRKLGFGDVDGRPPIDAGSSFAAAGSAPFTGTYSTTGYEMGTANAPTVSYSAKIAGCIEGNTDPAAGTYHFFMVLLAR